MTFSGKFICTEDFSVKKNVDDNLAERRRTCFVSSEHLMSDQENILFLTKAGIGQQKCGVTKVLQGAPFLVTTEFPPPSYCLLPL